MRKKAMRPDPVLSEQFRTLALKLQVFHNQGLRTFAFSSARQEEGKTFVCLHLAEKLAGMERRTLLVDFDNRRPALHQSFGLENDKGFSELVVSGMEDSLASSVREVKQNLFVLPSGNSFEKVSLPQFHEGIRNVLDQAKEEFTFVLIDTPPLLAVSDLNMIAPIVDGLILVIRAEFTKEDEVARVTEMIKSAGGNIVGTVLNRFNLKYGLGNQKYLDGYVAST